MNLYYHNGCRVYCKTCNEHAINYCGYPSCNRCKFVTSSVGISFRIECKEKQAHRLYLAIGQDCPCMR